MNMQGKVIVLTGASSGVGAAAARELHRLGAVVIPIGRTKEKTEKIATELAVDTYTVDFERLQDVHRLARELLGRLPRIDILVNNAGGIPTRRERTKDGNEPVFQVNTLAPLLLTQLLTPRLEASKGRVITTSSRSHKGAILTIEQLDKTDNMRLHDIYARSKLATALVSREYGRQHPTITVADFHPGIINSDFGRYMGIWANVLKRVLAPMLATPEQGAETLIYLASTEEDINRGYFAKKRRAQPSPLVQDLELARRLWDECERRIGSIGAIKP